MTDEELGTHYDAMFKEAQNPREEFAPTAYTKAFEEIISSTNDPRVRPNIKAPIQPRRYQQFGDMEVVNPRGENITELGQGASRVAEDFRAQPDLVREMGLGNLFVEATRPQVVKSGEQARRERAEADKIKTRVMDSMIQILEVSDNELTEMEAFDKLTEQYIEQAQVGIRKELVPRLTASPDGGFKELLDYRTGTIPTMYELGYNPSQEEVVDHMVRSEAKAQVLNFYREARMYDYALKSDILKGTGTYFDRTTNFIADAYKYIAEDETGNEFIQMRKKAGVIDKDAIVEATPMQYARNLNLPFRMVYNPLFDVLGETADLLDDEGDEKAMRTGMDEVRFAEKYGQKLQSPTLDLTDEYGITEPIKLMDAYLKEVLLETAVGRTVGNDVVSFHPDAYYDRMREGADNPDEIPMFGDPDAFVIGGTLAEVMLPVEFIPMMMSKVVAKGTRIPANWRTYAKVSKDIKTAGGLDGAYSVSDLGPQARNMIRSNSSVAAHAGDDAADVILGLERLEDGLPIDEAVKGLGSKGEAVAYKMVATPNYKPSMAAAKIDDIASKPKDYPALHIAAEDSISRRAAYGKDPKSGKLSRAKARNGTTQDVVAETLHHDSMKGKVAARLEGEVGLGDYHLLTDRVAVSKQFLDKKLPHRTTGKETPILNRMVQDVQEQLGPLTSKDTGPRIIKDDYFIGTGKPVIEGRTIMSSDEVTEIAINYSKLFQIDRTKDAFLNNIIINVKAGEPITYAQDVYLRQRVLEKMAMMYDKEAKIVDGFAAGLGQKSPMIMPIEEGTDFAKMTQVPSERRLDTARAVRSVTPRFVRDGLTEAKEILASTIKRTDLQNLGKADDPRIIALQNAVNEAQVSLQRQIPLVAAKLRKKDGFGDGEVVDTLLGKALKGEDPTELLTVNAPRLYLGNDPRFKAPQRYSDTSPRQLLPEPEQIAISDIQKTAFYEQLLGPSFNLPENQLAFAKTGALEKGLTDFEIYEVLLNMKSLVPTSLDTAAVAARTRKGTIAAKDVAITEAKIAFMTDTTRQLRLQKVIKETNLGQEVDLAFYQERLANPVGRNKPEIVDFNELSTELSTFNAVNVPTLVIAV